MLVCALPYQWTFILIGNDFLPFAEQKAKVQNKEHGHIYASEERMTNIFIKKWSSDHRPGQVALQNPLRRNPAQLQVTSADGLNLLNCKYPQFLPDQLDD